MPTHNTDVVIIGAGPVGLFSIFELGMLKIKAHVIDTLEDVGGQCSAMYPEKPIYDIPGFPQIAAQELIDRLKEQASPFEPVYHLGQQVVSVEKQVDKTFVICTNKDTKINCKAIIIAAGCGAFGPNRPPLENIEEYEESGAIRYMVTKKDEFKGKNIVIAGGGDSAVDWALSLADIANKIYFVHRRPKFRAAPESVEKLNRLADEGKIEMIVPYQLDALEGENGKLNAIKVKTLQGEEKTLEADHLLAFFGLAMELGPIADWGLNLHMSHIEIEQKTALTNIDGIFAVGDIANYENKLKLILSGFSEAATAAHSIYPIIYPDTALHFEYSTSKGV